MFFAFDTPYTYTVHLKRFVDCLRNQKKHHSCLQVTQLCSTLAGNAVPLLSITSNVSETLSYFDMIKCYSKDHKDFRALVKSGKFLEEYKSAALMKKY